MLRALLPAAALAVAALPALADDGGDWRFGGDAYVGGRSVVIAGETVDDVFAAGRNVTTEAALDGSAHLLGQNLTIGAQVAENVYGAGQTIEIEGPVAGNVNIMGQTLTIAEPISGDLRAMGASVEIAAPVAGSALIGAEEVTLDAEVTGDMALSAEAITWGENARVGGSLHLYTDRPDAVDVPDYVTGDVVVHETREFDAAGVPIEHHERPGFFHRLRDWLGQIIVVGLLGTLFAAVAPGLLANLRARAVDRPVFSGVVGAVGISALIGAVVLLAMTGFGILLIPVSLLAAVLLGIAGYVVGAYALGVWATGMAGRAVPDSTSDRAVAAFAGAGLAAVIGLIPWLGWLAVMALFLIGAGALVARVIRLEREDLAA